jgi:sigma-B regulation protein RsbU (phosphoserine phosphatase)
MCAVGEHTRAEKLLLEAARTCNSTLEYEELIERVLRLVITATRAEAAFVFRVDHNRSDMKIRFMSTSDFLVKTFTRELGKGVVDWVAQYREPVIVNNATDDPRVDKEIGRMGGVEMRSVISVPLIGKGQMIGVIEAINRVDGEFSDGDLDVLIGMANQIAVAIDNAALYRELQRESFERQLLYEIGMKLSGSLRLDEVMTQILESLKKAVDFDGAGVYLANPDTGQIESVVSIGYEADSDQHLKIGEGLTGSVAKTGEPVIVPDVNADDRYVSARTATRSEIVVPIFLEDRPIGVMNLESDRLNAFDERDRSLMAAFAAQAAISIERARMHEQRVSAQKLQEQLHIAREIQESFLPDRQPEVAGYDIAGRNVPSFEVGGDYYDFIRIVESQTGIAIGDVSGKGIPASLIMAAFRASLIAEIRNNYSIRTIFRKVNNLLYESVRPGSFVTAVYGVLDSKNHVLTFANCGHNLPLLVRNDGKIEYLREGGPVLGVSPDAEYEERPVYIHSGEIVLLYTDGVTEVFNSREEDFPVDKLVEIVWKHRRRSSREILDEIYTAVHAHAAPGHIFDDLTMIAIKRQS